MRFISKTCLISVSVSVAATFGSASCGRSPDPVGEPASTVIQPVWSNGDFESDAIGTAPPTGWTIAANFNPGITDTRPAVQTLASLNLAAGGTLMTAVVGGAAETQTDPDLLTNGTLRFPKYGQRATRVNSSGAGTGTGTNVNLLKQTMTVSLGDVDPVDNKVHVRFAIAPILENPAHTYTSQPYYYVRLQNLTKAQAIYQDFNASGQPGVPWKNFTDTSGQAAQYTDWQLVDVSPGDSLLAVGDQVELTVIAAGCSAGGHWGRVYVDAVGSGVPGLYSWATGPQLVNAGSTITYTLNYKNGGTTTTSGTKLDFVTPPNTTFQSVSLGAACTAPAVGATGTVTCPVGTLANGSTGSFQVTVNVPSGTANGTVILNGNYSIYATGVSALLGPKVFTTVTSSVSYADLGITISDGVAAIAWGQPTTYTIDVTNTGPVAAPLATVADTMPAQLSNVTWTCTATGDGVCTASGSGSINDTAASLPVGAHLQYTVSATIIAGSGNGQVVNTATVTARGTVSDPDTTNNTALDTDAIGTLRTLSLTKNGTTSAGRISSVPTSISCDVGCASDSGQFLDGSQVVLTAAPVAGATFDGWGGACSGTATSCTITMTGDQSVTASFTGAASAVAITGGNNQTAATSTAFALPLQVQVTDSSGRAVPGVTVSFTRPGSGASATLSAASAVTNASGLASVTATANATAGSYQVVATVSGLTPVSFALTNVGVPASITVSSGSGQSTPVTTAFAAELVALVRDAASQPVVGATVTFTPPASGASATLSATTAITDASGLARVTATATTVAGSYAVSAAVSGVAAAASFTLTNTAGPATTLALVAPLTRSVTVGTALGTFTAVLTDAHGNPVPGVTVSFSVPGSGATATLSAASAPTNASGQASITATAGTIAGSFSLTASASGTSPLSFALTTTADSPTTLSIVSGTNQSVTVDAAFAPLVVLVRDTHGNPVPGVTVVFTPPASGATASVTASASTDAAGHASTAATAGTVAGAYAVVASVSGLTPVSFALTNTAGLPVAIDVSSGSAQSTVVTTAFAAALVARVVDTHGNPVPGATVTFTPPASGASATLSAASAITDASGLARVTATASTVAGSYAVSAAVSGVASAASFALTNTAGTATTLALVAPLSRSVTVGAALGTFTAVLTDAHGNPVPGVLVSFSVPGSGATATLSAASASTNASGQASITATAGTIAGSFSLTASASGTSPLSFALTTTPDSPTTLSIVSGTNQSVTVDAAFAPLVVLVRDTHGNPVPGVTVAFTPPASGATASVTASASTDAAGHASSAATAGTVAGAYAVVASVSGLTPVSFALTNTAGAPVAIDVSSGSAQSTVVTTAFAAALVARVVDSHGNPVPGATVSFASPVSGASATLSATTAITDASGLARVTATATTVAGSYAISAAVSGVASAASFALTNKAGVPASITLAGGDGQSAEIETWFASPLQVIVRDAHGNPVPDAQVSFTVPGAGATATVEATVTTDEEGLAQTSATAGSIAGAYQVTATVSGVSTPVSFDLLNTAATATSIELNGGATQETIVATAFAQPLGVRVRDHAGNPVPGASVRFTAPSGAPTAVISAETVTTDAAGLAAVTAVADTHAGSYQVVAELAPGVVATFSLRNLPAAPAALHIAPASSPQATTVLHDFVAALAVRVEDRFGNPTPGVTVSYQAPTGAITATFSAATAVTDELGQCEVIATASAVAGSYLVTATVSGVDEAAPFALTNLAGAPATVTADSGAAQATEVDTDFAELLAVLVLDAQGNPVPGAVVSYAVSTGAATATLSASSVATGNDGTAAVRAHASTVTGAHTVTAVVTGAAAPVVFELTNTPGAPTSIVASVTATPQQAEVTTPYARSLLVRVADRFDNPVPGVLVSYLTPATGATGALSAPSASTDASGQTAVAITAGTEAGSFAATASIAGVATPAQFDLTNRHGPAHTITVVSGAAQTTVVATGFTARLVVRVSDAFGNPVLGESVQFTAPGADATAVLGTSSVTTDAQGLASTTATAGTVAGSYQIIATSAQGAAPASLALVNAPDVPASVVVVPGSTPQSAEVLHGFATALAVIVSDRFGNRVPGAQVSFTTTAAPGATLSAPQATTDGNGGAQVLAIADASSGRYQVTATVPGVAAPATFELTNTSSAPGAVVIVSGDGQSALATTAYAAPLVFRVLDGYGNAVPDSTLMITMPTGAFRAALTTTRMTANGSGELSLPLVASAELGVFQIVASSPGATSSATATLMVAAIPTTVTASAPAAISVDQRVTVTIQVAAAVGTPTGLVEIVGADGGVLATATLTAGTASAEVPLAVRGQYRLTVRYPAQGSFDASRSTTLDVRADEDAGSLSGAGGCSAGSGDGGLAPMLLVLLALLAWRRGGELARRAALLLAALLTLHAAPAHAQSDTTRSVNRFHAASAESSWFALDSLTYSGDVDVALAMTGDYAHRPMVVYDADGMTRTVVIGNSLVAHTGASVTLRDRVRLSTSVPMAVYQDGDDGTYNGMMLAGPKFAFGDMLVAGDVRMLGTADAALRVAVGLRLTLPTGSRSHYMSDSELGVEPRAQLAGSRGSFEYAAELSALLRRETELAGETFGSELRYAASAGARLLAGKLLIGPELIGAMPLVRNSATGHPTELGLGAHYALQAGMQLGLGATAGLINAVGTPDQRIFLSVSWSPTAR